MADLKRMGLEQNATGRLGTGEPHPTPDRYAIVCNYTEGISPVSPTARAYIDLSYLDNAHHRLRLVVRSRGGRWIRKWEATRRLTGFRVATVPAGHPRHGDERCTRATRPAVERRLGLLPAGQRQDGGHGGD